MGSTSTAVISYGLSKCKVAIPAYGHVCRFTDRDGGEFGNARKDDPEGEYPAFNESENILVMVTVGCQQRSCRTEVARLTDCSYQHRSRYRLLLGDTRHV